jgi:hypothetical protein
MNVLNLLKQTIKGLQSLSARLDDVDASLDAQKILTGRLLVNQIKEHGAYENIQDAEFKVFSQFGDDGIIQYLINNVETESRTFVEFGVEDYREANTRFLLVNDNWRGLVIDGSESNVEAIKQGSIYWQQDLTAVSHFITTDNINEIITRNNFAGELGLLSIDIDGNDYWVWEAINVVSPAIVVVEYNSIFGASRAVTVPYDPKFRRGKAHPSQLYFGASLRALARLAESKGYQFVGSNSAGNNAYFVRRDKLGRVRPVKAEAGYVESRFRESRDKEGRPTYLSGAERLKEIEEMTVFDVEKKALVKVKELRD